MKNIKVIGLTGVKGSGKTLTANIIDHNFKDVKEVALADKIKDTCAKVFNIPRYIFDSVKHKDVAFSDGPKKLGKYEIGSVLEEYSTFVDCRTIDSKVASCETYITTPRNLLQIIGTEVLREFGGEDIHCDSLVLDPESLNIVSDVRFFNEFNYLNNKYDFLPLYIKNDKAERKGTKDLHRSEKDLFTFNSLCQQIDNNSSIRNLEKKVVIAVNDWLLK